MVGSLRTSATARGLYTIARNATKDTIAMTSAASMDAGSTDWNPPTSQRVPSEKKTGNANWMAYATPRIGTAGTAVSRSTRERTAGYAQREASANARSDETKANPVTLRITAP